MRKSAGLWVRSDFLIWDIAKRSKDTIVEKDGYCFTVLQNIFTPVKLIICIYLDSLLIRTFLMTIHVLFYLLISCREHLKITPFGGHPYVVPGKCTHVVVDPVAQRQLGCRIMLLTLISSPMKLM